MAIILRWRYTPQVGAGDVTSLAAIVGPRGEQGDKGWSAVLSNVADGARIVQQVTDWTGGQGTKPPVGGYIGAAGLVVDIAEAVDIRGEPSISPYLQTPTGDGAAYSITAGVLPIAGQLAYFTPHVNSTVDSPSLSITVGDTTVTNALRNPEGAALTNPLKAGATYLIRWGGGVSLVLNDDVDLKLDAAQNLSELTDPATARDNLGLGSAATQGATAFAASSRGVIPFLSGVSGTGSAYTITASEMPVGGQLFYFTPHVDSTADQPSLTINVGAENDTATLRDSDGLGLARPLKAGNIYLVRWGGSVALLLSGSSTIADRDLSAKSARTITAIEQTQMSPLASVKAVQGLAVPSAYGSLFPNVIAGEDKPIQIQPVERETVMQLSGAAATLDLTYMIPGTSIIVYLRFGEKIIAGAGRTFVGRAGGMVTGTGFHVLRFTCFYSGIICCEEVSGSSPTYGAADTITYDSAIVRGGQSNANLAHLYGGVGGFSKSSRSSSWMATPQPESIYWINGATGGTAIDRRSVAGGSTAYWWDVGANSGAGGPGPALTTYMTAISTAISAGSPTPEWTFWTQGESDAGALQSGDLTVAQMTSTIRAVWTHIRATYTSMKFLVNMIGSHDNRAADHGANGARVAYLDAIAAETFAHHGIELYDLPRCENNIHYYETGYQIVGAREALHWANVQHAQSNPVGPVVTGAVASNGGKTITLSVNWGGPAFVPPVSEVFGPYPYGIYALAAGDGPVDEPVSLVSATLSGANIILTSETDLTGGKIGGPYGYAETARRGFVLRDYKVHPDTQWPGQPLRSFLVDIS